jgi:hypothetical protein
MDTNSALQELEALAEKLGVDVIYDRFTGDAAGSGGLCKVRGRWRVIIERRCSAGERLPILAKALAGFDLEQHFLSPSLRQLITGRAEP